MNCQLYSYLYDHLSLHSLTGALKVFLLFPSYPVHEPPSHRRILSLSLLIVKLLLDVENAGIR